jgi:tripartite-type tricarboxylate transporter receptor subunit TctC
MRKSLGQSIIIENVGGADGSIGTGRAARARPDGYTIINGLMESQVLNGAFYSLPYDVLNDFAPVSPLVTFPNVLLAKKTISAANVNELIGMLKANPGKASAGIGSNGLRLSTVFFQKETGTQFTMVPYRGVAPAMQDLLAGQIDLLFSGPEQLPLVRAGSIKAYAVTSDARLASTPDIPTIREVGLPALSYTTWAGIFAPKGTPKDMIGKLNAATVEALVDPAVRSRVVDLGMEVIPRERQTPEAARRDGEGCCREVVANHQSARAQDRIIRGVRSNAALPTRRRDGGSTIRIRRARQRRVHARRAAARDSIRAAHPACLAPQRRGGAV